MNDTKLTFETLNEARIKALSSILERLDAVILKFGTETIAVNAWSTMLRELTNTYCSLSVCNIEIEKPTPKSK